MIRFNRLSIITGVAALVFAVFGMSMAVVNSVNADSSPDHSHPRKDHGTNGLTISYLGI